MLLLVKKNQWAGGVWNPFNQQIFIKFPEVLGLSWQTRQSDSSCEFCVLAGDTNSNECKKKKIYKDSEDDRSL